MEFTYGSPISYDLSNYLKEYTSNNDRADVSAKTGVGSSTIRDLVYRLNNITESNSKAIIELMKIAVVNCTDKIEYSKKAKKDLELQLQTA